MHGVEEAADKVAGMAFAMEEDEVTDAVGEALARLVALTRQAGLRHERLGQIVLPSFFGSHGAALVVLGAARLTVRIGREERRCHNAGHERKRNAGNQPGHEIEYPLAVVILGGLVTSTLLNLFLLPPLYLLIAQPSQTSSE